ncbi:MAG: UvrB/UvrC motif-containing protein [Eubacteriales bacterium]
MTEAAENMEFEKAARIRDRIAAIKKISEKQKVVRAKVAEQDVFALHPKRRQSRNSRSVF